MGSNTVKSGPAEEALARSEKVMASKGIVVVAMLWTSLAHGYGQKDTKEDTVKNFQVKVPLVLSLY